MGADLNGCSQENKSKGAQTTGVQPRGPPPGHSMLGQVCVDTGWLSHAHTPTPKEEGQVMSSLLWTELCPKFIR